MTKRDRAVVNGVLAALGGLFLVIVLVSVLGPQWPQPVRVAAIIVGQLSALLVMALAIRRREKKEPRDAR